jgi:hypothetical protein
MKSRYSAVLAAVLMSAAIVACSTATPYQPDLSGQRVSGGYSETRIEDGRYRVNFSGNSLTSRDRVEGYLLSRAAELTVRDGYDWFLIIDRLTERDVETYVRPDPFYRPWYGIDYGFWQPHWRYYRPGLGWHDWHPEWGGPFWGDGVDVDTIERFEAHAEIVMRRGPLPTGEEHAFDAHKVIEDLGPTIERPKPRGE